MKYGADYLGGKYFKSAILKTHPTGWCAGIFLRTFGNSTGFIEKMCQSGKFSEIVVHVAPFDKDHRYEFDKYVPQVKKDVAKLEEISRRNPSVVVMISPFCEHNHSRDKMAVLFKELKQIAPSCLMVNSIWKGQEVPGVITEIHLENSKLKKKPSGDYIVAFDGFGGDGSGDMPDTDVQKILNHYSDARQIRLWNFRYNGKYGHKTTNGKPWPAPKDRIYWPDENYLKGHNALMKTREGSLTYPNNALYKPFADDHGQGGKDNKAMVITFSPKNRIDVFDSLGKKIDTMQRVNPNFSSPGSPLHGAGRFYSGKYAYQLGDIAQKNTGSRRIKIEGLPLTDADLRSGKFK